MADSGFLDLEADCRYGTETRDGEWVCIFDADTVTIQVQSGDVRKEVDAYALGPSTALASMGGDCSQPFYAEALRLTYDTLAMLGDRAQAIGEPFETPLLRIVVDKMPTEDSYGFYDDAMAAPVVDIPPGIEFPEHPGGRYPEDPAVHVTGDSARRWRDLLPADSRAAFVHRRVRALDGRIYLATWVPIMPGDEPG